MEVALTIAISVAVAVITGAGTLAGSRVYRGRLAQQTIDLLEAGLKVERDARERDKEEHRREYDELKQRCSEETAELRGRVTVLTDNFAERLVTAVVEGFERHRRGGGT